MPKRITLETILTQTKRNLDHFYQTAVFKQTRVSATQSGEWLTALTTQMYQIWQQHPRAWRKTQLMATILWAVPEWRVLANERGLGFLDVGQAYVQWLQEQGELRDAKPLVAGFKDCEWRLITPADEALDTNLLTARLRVLLQAPAVKTLTELATFEAAHTPELLLLAGDQPLSALQAVVTDTLPDGVLFTKAAAKYDLSERFWQVLIKTKPAGAHYNESTFQGKFDAVVAQADFHLTAVERVLLAAAFAQQDLSDADAVTQWFAGRRACLRPEADAQLDQALAAVLAHRQPLSIVSVITALPAHRPTPPTSLDLRLAKMARDLTPSPVKRPLGYDRMVGRYYYSQKPQRYLTQASLAQAEALTKGSKPADIIVATQQALKTWPTLAAATEFAQRAGILIPALVAQQPDVNLMLSAVADSDWLDGADGDLRVADRILSWFYNDLFLTTGRMPRRWTKAAVAQVMGAPNSRWQNLSADGWITVYNVLNRGLYWLEDDGGINNANALLAEIERLCDAAQPAEDKPQSDAMDRLYEQITSVYGDQARSKSAYWPQHMVAVYVLGDFLSLQLLGKMTRGERRFASDDDTVQFLRNWFEATVMPTYTPATAAGATGVSLLLVRSEFWNQVFYALINDFTAVSQAKRVQLAVQSWLNRPTPPTKADLLRFAAANQPLLQAARIDLSTLKRLVPISGKTLAKKAAKAWRKKH